MKDVEIVVDMCLHSLVSSMKTMKYSCITPREIEKFINHLSMIETSDQNKWLKQTLDTLLGVMKTQNRKSLTVSDLEILIEINKVQK